MGAITVILAVLAVVVGFLAWPVMILLGSIHAAWPVVPALGYWHSYFSVLVIKLISLV